MRKIIKLSVLSIILFVASCSKDDNNTVTTTVNNEVNDFVWKGLNSWYNWQPNVINLEDSKNDDLNEYNTYLNSYSYSEELFESLLYDYGTTDRFSWFIEDYEEQKAAFQGISLSLGIRLKAVQINDFGDVIFYIRYVADNSPASNAGIKRGDIINAINGTEITTSNYDTVVGYLDNETVTFSFVNESNGNLTTIGDKTITAIELTVNPIHYTKIFNDINGSKVGYLVFTSFSSSYNDELNEVFATFKSEGINELVLDLRLNGGGSVLTSAYLASMIYGSADTNTPFATLKFNSKHSDQDGSYYFENSMDTYDLNGESTGSENINRLNTISRIYVLTSGSTASASEMIINGLKPFMEVNIIGTTTYGKNVGSITLYDSPSSDYTNESNANNNHLNAMQPIVFQIYNKNNESDYTQGFDPDNEIAEYNYWNNIFPFGDENEVVLKAALDDIRGIIPKNSIKAKNFEQIKKLDEDVLRKRFDKEMYIEDNFSDKIH